MPPIARRWLWSAVIAGLVLGLAQQVRGAHYMSHTLWTAWLCWTAAAVMDRVFSEWISQTPKTAQAQVPGLSTLLPGTQ
jgi:membrane-associated PAP2 superfamily phosphatase